MTLTSHKENNQHTEDPKDFQDKPALTKVLNAMQVTEFQRFFADTNGLLAGKENLKLQAITTQIRVNYYHKWSEESNKLLALAVNLKRRFKTGR